MGFERKQTHMMAIQLPSKWLDIVEGEEGGELEEEGDDDDDDDDNDDTLACQSFMYTFPSLSPTSYSPLLPRSNVRYLLLKRCFFQCLLARILAHELLISSRPRFSSSNKLLG